MTVEETVIEAIDQGEEPLQYSSWNGRDTAKKSIRCEQPAKVSVINQGQPPEKRSRAPWKKVRTLNVEARHAAGRDVPKRR